MAKEYKASLKQLGDRLKSEPVKTPIQEVRPVEAVPEKQTTQKAEANKGAEVHFNFWGERSLMQRVKIHSARTGKSIKEICTEALEQYLPKE